MRRSMVMSGFIVAGVASAEIVMASGALAAGPDVRSYQEGAYTTFGGSRPSGTVPQGPRFNLPTGSTAQAGAIDLYIKKLIRHTPKGGEINVSLFRLQTTGMAKELVAAKQRGAKVRVILDSDSLNYRRETYDYLRRNLGATTTKSSWIYVCPKGRGCIAPGVKGQWAKNHNKFYAFSHTYKSRNVVVQASGNATGGMYNQYNDGYTMVDAKLYAAYREYFYDLLKHVPNANYYRTYNAGFRSVTFFPKASGSDPIADILDKVSCTGGTRIRMSSGLFTRTGITSRLTRLDDKGCDVKIVSGSYGEAAVESLSRPGPNGGVSVRYFTQSQTKRAHSKYLLIDGMYNGARRKMVWTGSHSYTSDALRWNDEAMVTINHAWTYDRYLENWNRVYAAAKGTLVIAPWAPKVPTVPDNATEPGAEPETQPGQPTTPEVEIPPTDTATTPPTENLPPASGE